MTTVKALLAEARQKLQTGGIDSAALDARLLLQHVTGLAHADIIANPGHEITAHQANAFDNYVVRRAGHEPVSRILGTREFFGRAFVVTPDVLDPRADTETLVELCLSHLSADHPRRILDLGTGSGIIALTLAAELPLARVDAVDVSEAALGVAQRNAKQLGVALRCSFIPADWFSGVTGKYDLIVSNPPYIETAAIAGLAVDVRHFDPWLALDGGADGLLSYRIIARECGRFLAVEGKVAVEIGAGQQTDVLAVFESHGFSCLEARNDLSGQVRALLFGVAKSN